MPLDDWELLTILHGLSEVCKNSAECLGRSAHSACSPVLRGMLEDLWHARHRMQRQLESEIDLFGGTQFRSVPCGTRPETELLAPTAYIVTQSDKELLDDCLYWERETLAAYEDAACETLPAEPRQVIDQQVAGIRQSIGSIQQRAEQFEVSRST